jgi:hypothetical protein
MEALVQLNGCVTVEPGRDRPRPLVSQEGQGLPRVGCVLHAGPVGLPGWSVAPAQPRGRGTGPRERGVPPVLA